MPPEHHGDAHAADHEGNGACHSRADDAPSRAEDGHAPHLPRGIDEQKVKDNIDPVHQKTDPHGRFGVPCRTKQRTENRNGRPGQHGGVQNEKVLGSQVLNGRVNLHPHRHLAAQRQHQHSKKRAADQNRQHRLRRGFPRPLRIPRPAGLRHEGQKAHANGGNGAANQPVDRAGSAHRRSRLRTDCADHSSVDILHRRLHQLFQHSRPRQRQNGRHHPPRKKRTLRLFHDILTSFFLYYPTNIPKCQLCTTFPARSKSIKIGSPKTSYYSLSWLIAFSIWIAAAF